MAAPGAKLLQALQYVVIGAAIVHFLPRRFLFFLCAGAVMLVVSLVMGQEKILYHPTVPPDIKTIADNRHRTGDLGGSSTTEQITDEIIKNLEI